MSFLGSSSKTFSYLFRCSDLWGLFPFFSVSFVIIMDMIFRTFIYFCSDHSCRRIVNLGISKFLTIILAILVSFKESFAYSYM